MHPDLKVGLALAMLIVGFAGAMCFQHRPENAAAREDEFEPIANLGAELELLPVRTYGSEQVPGNSASDAANVEDGAFESAETLIDLEQIVLEPIDSGDDEALPSVAQASSPSSIDGVESESPGTYIVQPGDTLSGISARFLGSTQRYREIFEANRQLLNSPDDLRPGMELRLPPRVRSVTSTPQSEGEDAVEPDSGPTPATARRFTPIVPR